MMLFVVFNMNDECKMALY